VGSGGRTGRIYTEQCPWANGWQVWHLDNPLLLVISVVGIAIGITMLMNKISFLLFKRRNKAIEHSQTGWTGVSTRRLALASLPPFLPPNIFFFWHQMRRRKGKICIYFLVLMNLCNVCFSV
jgi:hypothetical protein